MRLFKRRVPSPEALLFQYRHAYIAARRAGLDRDDLASEAVVAEHDFRMSQLWEGVMR